MIPVLFNENETVFTTQGIGALTDAITCTVTEERNGMYELEMTYPISGIHYADIQYRSIIVAIPSPYRKKQPFRVYKITRPLNGIVTVYAQHLSYDLNAIPVSPFTAVGISNAFTELKSSMAVANNFAFISAITNTSSHVSYATPTACRSILGGIQGSILDIFGGEYEWDNWTVRLWANRGADNGVTIRYGKNMTDLSAETDGENTVNGIYPYWQKDDVLVTCNPTIIWVDGAAKNKAVPVDFSNDFEEQPTAAQLRTRAEQYLEDNDIGTVPTSIDVSFVDLSKMDEYKGLIASLEKCDLCDTVTVQYEALGVDVKSKVVKIVTDVLKENYESMEVGTVRADIAQTISDTANKVDNVVRPDGSLIAEALRGFINGSLVNLYAQYDAAKPAGAEAILFECNDPANPLYGAMAMGTQGLMISRTKKADGTGWNWTTALTSQGLMAGIIIAGILTDKTGQSWWNLDTGDAVFGGDVIFKGALQAATGTFSGNLQAAKGTFAGELTAPSGNIGGWNINANNLMSPNGNMIFDAQTAQIFTQRQNGNKGVTFWDDGITFYSWEDDGNRVGKIGSTIIRESNGIIRHGLDIWFDYGDYCDIRSGHAENTDIKIYMRFVDIGSATLKEGISVFQPMYLNGNRAVEGDPTHRLRLQWDGARLAAYVDSSFVGYVQFSQS